jgi:uncharacterized protein (TIGR02285 family)
MTIRRWVERLTVLCLVAFAGAVPSAFARDTIVWAVLDFPPFQIRDGEFRNTGSFDGLLDLLIRELPEFDHEVVTMTFARREEEIRQGQRLCTPGLFRTPAREKLVTFSMPALIHLDNRLVLLAGTAKRLGTGTSVDLPEVLKRKDLIAGIISSRSFAPNIDPVVQEFAQATNVVMRPIKSWQMFELLLSGEIDYTILFPHESAYLARQHGGTLHLGIRPIAGTPPYIFTHVACTKGEWGEATMAHIDRIIAAHRKQPEYRALSERWYDEADRALIRKYYPNMLTSPAGT